MALSFDTKLSDCAGIKKPALQKLTHLGIRSVRDLLYHFPHRYEDFSEIKPIQTIAVGEKCTVAGTVKNIKAAHTWKQKMFLTEVLIEDTSGSMRLLWFNQRFIAKMLHTGMPIRVSGKVTKDTQGYLMQNPAVERTARDTTHTGRLVPVYPETHGLTSKFFRWQIALLFKNIQNIQDPIPEEILKRLSLPSLKQALRYIHFPKNDAEELLARKRFAFDEMLLVQLKALQIKAEFESGHARALPFDEAAVKKFIATFPFTLTNAQRKAAYEILCDIARERPMNRLLNGDVGSGKTIVAAISMFATAEHRCQTALLAPTEVLARQHFETLSKIFSKTTHHIALLTGSYRILGNDTVTRPTLLKAIRSGIPRIVVGTHALLQEDVAFDTLSLIIVDEQHRFGVAQRAALQEASLQSADGSAALVPHFLTMTATPIPRTLTLAFFGNLDLSILDEMPSNRKPIITQVARALRDRERVYAFIKNEVAKGRQAFIIFPLVEESLAMKDVKAAVAEHKRLEEEVFPKLRIGLLHGKMKAKEKEQMMRDFKEKKYDILVATAVVEVGIDVPNASVILIEEAERFGLAQLHQFRGRVGRGAHQSYCFLFSGTNASNNERLSVLEKSINGFDIAEADLAFRGPGAFFGTRQSGLPDIAMENLTNMKLVKIARDEALAILRADPLLKRHPLLLSALTQFEKRIHLE